MKKIYTVVFEIDQVWIEDGFELTDFEAKEMLWDRLPNAFDHEIDAHVVSVEEKDTDVSIDFDRVRED